MTETNTAPNTAPIGAIAPARKLLRSTVIAAITAVLLLVTAVLPAEYGVDPTGIGRLIGLTRMGEIKMSLAREAAEAEAAEAAAMAAGSATPAGAAAAPASPAPAAASPAAAALGAAGGQPAPAGTASEAVATDTTRIVLQPGQAREFKLAMREGARVSYAWSTDGGAVNYDTHGDKSTPPAIKYHGYGKGTGKQSDEGVLVAAFDGMHGWFWRNRTRGPVLVTLHTSGDYQEIREIK